MQKNLAKNKKGSHNSCQEKQQKFVRFTSGMVVEKSSKKRIDFILRLCKKF